jgi:hypothetical protein
VKANKRKIKTIIFNIVEALSTVNSMAKENYRSNKMKIIKGRFKMVYITAMVSISIRTETNIMAYIKTERNMDMVGFIWANFNSRDNGKTAKEMAKR